MDERVEDLLEDLRNALVAAKTMCADSSTYAAANEVAVTGLAAVEPSPCYVATATASVSSGYMIKETAASGTTYGSNATCTETQAPVPL